MESDDEFSAPNVVKRQRLSRRQQQQQLQHFEDGTASSIISDPEPANQLEPKLLVFYSAGRSMPETLHEEHMNEVVEVRVDAKYLSRTNAEVQRREVWGGSPLYTDDSDIVAILAHAGRVFLRLSPPMGCVGLSVLFRVCPKPEEGFVGSERHGFRSREWVSDYTRGALELLTVRCIDSRPAFKHRANLEEGLVDGKKEVIAAPGKSEGKGDGKNDIPVFHMIGEVSRGRGRPRGGNSGGGAGSMDDSSSRNSNLRVLFSHENSPWLQYSLRAIGDQDMRPVGWTATALRSHCLYFESRCFIAEDGSNVERFALFELSLGAAAKQPLLHDAVSERTRIGKRSHHNNHHHHHQPQQNLPPLVVETPEVPPDGRSYCCHDFDSYSWSLVTQVPAQGPELEGVAPGAGLFSSEVPLRPGLTKQLEGDLNWEELEWSEAGVTIRGSHYSLSAMRTAPRTVQV